MANHGAELLPEGFQMRLLGGFLVSVGARTVDDAAWRWRKSRAIVKLLGLTKGHRLHKEEVLDRLWPDQLPKAAANNLYQAIHLARLALEPLLPASTASDWLRLQGDNILLDPRCGLSVDADDFEVAATAALRAHDTGALEQAVRLYAGELLPEDRYEDWTIERRETLHRLHLSLLMALASQHERTGDFPQAIGALEQAVASEPANEEAHVGLMRLYARAGLRSNALQQFQRLKESLRRDLDADPGPDSIALYQNVLAGHLPPGEHTPIDARRRSRSRPSPERSPAARAARLVREAPPHLPGNLPASMTSFVGRRRELADLRELLPTTRLLTLAGPAGGGKTRLALALAESVRRDFQSGAWWVDLAPLADPALLASAVATSLNVREQPGRSILETLSEDVGSRNVLIVLDNCEHLLDECSRVANALLRAGPTPRILATSREALCAPGELLWRVPLMSLTAAAKPSFEDAQQSEAIQLFVARAKSSAPAFALTLENVRAVADICRRLDGMPLAIELAAARARHLPVAEILMRLDDRFRFLVGMRSMPDRHRTLRAALDWSYDLLGDAERLLFNRLSVFPGSFTLDAAEAACAGEGVETAQILDLISRLVDRSLIAVEEGPGGSIRYRLLETMREYGEERLQESGAATVTRRKHRDFFLALVEQARPDLLTPRETEWFERFEGEHDNLRAALDWSLETGEPEAVLRMGGELWFFWETHGYWREGRTRLEAALNMTRGAQTTARADALHGAGRLAWCQADFAGGSPLLEEALDLSRKLQFKHGVTKALFTLALHMARHGDLAQATTLLEEAVVVARELGISPMIANRLAWLWPLVYQRGDFARAVNLAEECATVARACGYFGSAAFGRRAEAWLAHRTGNYDEATALSKEALAIHRTEGGGRSKASLAIPWMLAELGELALEQGNYQRATAIYEESLALSRELGSKDYVAISLNGLANLARDLGDFARSTALHQESLDLGKEIESRPLVASCAYGLGLVERYRGGLDRAASWLDESLSLYEAMGNVAGAADALHALSIVACDLGDYERAAALIQESARLLKGGAGRLTQARCLEALAAVGSGRGNMDQATRLLASASAAREVMGTPLPPYDRADQDQRLATLRAGLGKVFSATWTAGRGLPVEQAIGEALGR